MFGYDIAYPGTTLHLRVRHCMSGYDIVSPGTTLGTLSIDGFKAATATGNKNVH